MEDKDKATASLQRKEDGNLQLIILNNPCSNKVIEHGLSDEEYKRLRAGDKKKDKTKFTETCIKMVRHSPKYFPKCFIWITAICSVLDNGWIGLRGNITCSDYIFYLIMACLLVSDIKECV